MIYLQFAHNDHLPELPIDPILISFSPVVAVSVNTLQGLSS